MEFTPQEKLMKARVLLIKGKRDNYGKNYTLKPNPFFAHLALHLKFVKCDNLPPFAKFGVDKYGNMLYKEHEVINTPVEQLIGVILHETMHCSLMHLEREGKRDKIISNMSQDLCVNDMLRTNGFELPEGLVPYNHEYTFKGTDITVEDIDKKNFEMIYDEIYPKLKNKQKDKSGFGFGRWDEHIYGDKEGESDSGLGGSSSDGKDNKNEYGVSLSDLQKEMTPDKWKKALIQSVLASQTRGDLPSGMERILDDILAPDINWRAILYRYMVSMIPFDSTMQFPSRRGFGIGVYLPSMKKEYIEGVIAVDVSGSISQRQYSQFIMMVIDIVRSFENFRCKFISCDCVVQDVLDFSNSDIEKIKNIKIKGGGGTDFQPTINYITEHEQNAKFLIYLTDGYSCEFSLEKVPNLRVLWVLTKDGTDEYIKDKGEILRIDEEVD